MLGSTVLIQLFANARHMSLKAKAATNAIAEAQNCAENLYAADDPEAWLGEYGFRKETEKHWAYDADGYTLYVTDVMEENEKIDSGVIRTFNISAVGDGKDLFTIPSSRYMPKEVGSP